jgi:hypothetical protein
LKKLNASRYTFFLNFKIGLLIAQMLPFLAKNLYNHINSINFEFFFVSNAKEVLAIDNLEIKWEFIYALVV